MTLVNNAPREATQRILVADADEQARTLLRESLRVIGCDVIDAADGREALVNALVHRPALVITDIRLPVFDGFELCAVLRHDSQTRTVPILIVTSESRKSELDRARHAGADSILIKPVTPEALLREVQRLIGDAPNKDRKPASTIAMEQPPRRKTSRAGHRYETTTPPILPPQLVCPSCDRALTYECSHLGGVKNQPEQWDSYACPESCGTFEYRHRTRSLRQLR
jgi:twitching motility two-component system response regulator PilG